MLSFRSSFVSCTDTFPCCRKVSATQKIFEQGCIFLNPVCNGKTHRVDEICTGWGWGLVSPCLCKDKAHFLGLCGCSARGLSPCKSLRRRIIADQIGTRVPGLLTGLGNVCEEMRSPVPGACCGASSHQHRTIGKHIPLHFHSVNPAAPFLQKERLYRLTHLEQFWYFYYPSTTQFKS